MSRTEVLEVEGLTKSFTLHNIDGRSVVALDGVDLTVKAGEHVALAGSSGAGKSSLLKCVYRTYLPSSGSVVLVDEHGERIDLLSLSEREIVALRGRRLGYVSQFLRSQPRRTALQIVADAAVMRGVVRGDAVAMAEMALNRLRLDRSLWDVHASVLSGGERQRVNLAAGTVSPPRLLLLDEPVSALDPANRAAALDLIGSLTESGVAVLSVFHDLEAMERLASRVVLMRAGRVIEDGPPTEVLQLELGVAR
ncbi:MAG: ATP-binding cassette domain-containing protein [Ilumatobacteraceae bacterium]|nr:ATP-binding cassette domain-containing protein [Ilumatobacteraceae bacterium]MBL6760160.1 ATP-binding cassette domain-containing protein [Ilumatobacteraceae bacterium]